MYHLVKCRYCDCVFDGEDNDECPHCGSGDVDEIWDSTDNSRKTY